MACLASRHLGVGNPGCEQSWELSLRWFLEVALHDAARDHSTFSRPRCRIDAERQQAVLTRVVQRLSDAGVLTGKAVSVDAVILKANATLQRLVHLDADKGYDAFLQGPPAASDISPTMRVDLTRANRKRREKTSSDD